jgi:hypothetical protein
MSTIKTIAAAYLGIGGLLLGTQVAMAKNSDPSCVGGARHTLIERTFPPQRTALEELQATLKGEKRRSSLLAIGRHVAGWVPDLYTHVIAGPMTLGAFVSGGTICEPARPQRVCGPDCQEVLRRMAPLRNR